MTAFEKLTPRQRRGFVRVYPTPARLDAAKLVLDCLAAMASLGCPKQILDDSCLPALAYLSNPRRDLRFFARLTFSAVRETTRTHMKEALEQGPIALGNFRSIGRFLLALRAIVLDVARSEAS